MLVRVRPEVRERLERDAKRNRRSLSLEAEMQLTDALRVAPRGSAQIRALAYLLTQIATAGKTLKNGADLDWRGNRSDYEAFRVAIVEVLNALEPPAGGPGERSEYRMVQTAEEAGRLIAAMVLANLTTTDDLPARGDRRGARRGSLFYAFPQVARDLGIAGVPEFGEGEGK
jgi:hypothetical protein